MIVIAQLPHTVCTEILAGLRVEREISIASTDETLWLRAEAPDAGCLTKIRTLPWNGLFEWAEPDKLVPMGHRLPTSTLPAGLRWHRLSDWLRPATITTVMPGTITENSHLQVSLVHGTSLIRSANLLMTTMDILHDYVDEAPQTRLFRLRFAASGDGRVAIYGEPLLPLSGKFYHCAEGVAVPLGYRIEPTLGGAALTETLSLAPAEIALFHLDGSFERLRQDDFLQLTRSAARLTYERFTMEADTPAPLP